MNGHERLEDKLKLLQFSIDSIPDAVYCFTMDGRFWNCNAAACEMLGYSREELLSLSVYDIDPDYSCEDGRSDLEELKRTGTLYLNSRHRTRDGCIIPVEITSNYLILDDFEYICCIARDISELRRAQAELEKRVEERTAELAETVRALRFTQFAIDRALDQAFWMTEDGRFFYVNDAACRSLGYSREELLEMSVPDINPTCSPDEFAVYWSELRENGAITFETCHRAKDGRVSLVAIRANHVVFDGKEYNCAFATDITERKRAEEELLLSRFCIDKAAIGIYQTAFEGSILSANDFACRNLGYSREELLALRVTDIDPVITREKMLEIKSKLDAIGSATHETVHRRRNGTTFPVEITANYVEFQGKSYTFSFVKDITERKRDEDTLRKAHDELETRVRERTEQLASLAAELSLAEEKERRRIATQLHDQVGQTLIMSKIRLDSLSPGLSAGEFEAACDEIREQISRSIEDIRSLTFQLSPPLLYEVGFEAAVEWLGEEFEEKYGFQVEFQDDGKTKPLNEETGVALYQMVRELLVNIAKHAKAKKVMISIEKVSDKIRVIVADDGSGFDRMNGMRRKKRGFGHFNIRQRMEYMGGKFELESTIGHGTHVTLLLPLRKKKKTINRRMP